MVTQVDAKARKVSVSIKALEIAEEKEAVAQYGSTDSGASLGDILGAALSKAKEEDDEETAEKPKRKSRAKSEAKTESRRGRGIAEALSLRVPRRRSGLPIVERGPWFSTPRP